MPDDVLDATVTVSEEAVFKELSGEGVLLDLASGMYFGLDETSTRLWKLIQAHGSLRRVFDAMLAEFDVDAVRLRADLIEFVGDLQRRNLVTIQTTQSS